MTNTSPTPVQRPPTLAERWTTVARISRQLVKALDGKDIGERPTRLLSILCALTETSPKPSTPSRGGEQGGPR